MLRHRLFAASSVLAVTFAAPALAQDESAAPNEDAIVVTAQLVEQDPIEVPFALTAYSGEFLSDLGVTEFDKLGQYVPGFDVQNQSPNNPGFVMRGITSDDGSAFNEPRVSVFQDGVSISKSRGSYVELFDMERIEVAKGPQSTLYGRGALIGAVNLVQAKADPGAVEGYLYGSYGNFDAWRLDGTVNLPLTETLAVRFAGRFKERQGYVENLLGGEDYNGIRTEAVRGALRWESGATTFDLIGNYQHDRATGTSFKSIAFNPTDPATGAVIGDAGRNSAAALAPAAGFEGGKPLGLDREVWGVTGIFAHELSDRLSLDATASYREFDGTEIFDPDGISLPLLTAAEEARGDQTMATLRLTYSDDRFTGFVGGTWFNEDGSQRGPGQFDERLLLARLAGALNGNIPGLPPMQPGRPATDPAPLAVLTSPAFGGAILQALVAQQLMAAGMPPAAAFAQAQAALPTPVANAIAGNLGSAYVETTTNYSQTDSWDLFADATFQVTPKLEVGAGIRYSHDDKRTGLSASLPNGRSIISSFQFAMAQALAGNPTFVGLLTQPGAAQNPGLPLLGIASGPTPGNGDVISRDHGDDGLTWRLVARYEVSDDLSLYANYARGRRPEVLSVAPPAASAPLTDPRFEVLPAETVDSFEVGFKSALAGRRLFLDGSAFFYQYKNFQTTEQQGTNFVPINAGEAESYGLETQLRWKAHAWLDVFATYAWNHSRFTSLAREGNRFRLSPDHSASAGFALKVPAGPVTIDFTPSVLWQSEVFFDDDNDRPDLQAGKLIPDPVQDEFQEGYATVDARLGVTTLDGRFRLEGFVTNLFDQAYIKDAGNVGDSLGMPTFIAGEPRMYGLAASARF